MASDWLKGILHPFPSYPKVLGPTGCYPQDCMGIFADIKNTHGKVKGQSPSLYNYQIGPCHPVGQ